MSVVAPISFGSMIIVAAAVFMSVFMGLWVYHDAKERNIENPALWVLLAVLLSNFVGLIIYLVVRSTQGRKNACPSCGFLVPESQGFCPRCGAQQPPVSAYPGGQGKAKKYFRSFIVSVIVFGVALVLLIAMIVATAVWDAHGNNSFPRNYRHSGVSIGASHQAINIKTITKDHHSEMTFDRLNGAESLTSIHVEDGEAVSLDVEYGARDGVLWLELRGCGQAFPLVNGQNEPALSEGRYTIYVYAQEATHGNVVVKVSDNI